MYTLGFCGGFDPSYPTEDPVSRPRLCALYPGGMHDAAAVLVKDGEVIAAIELERLNRIKHSNCFAGKAIRHCLDMTGLRLRDIDRIGFYCTEKVVDRTMRHAIAQNVLFAPPGIAREFTGELIHKACGEEIDRSRLSFIEHHVTHAVSAFAMSSFERALVVTLDGAGDMISGSVSVGNGRELTRVYEIPMRQSLGHFFIKMIELLGYKDFDEYKVMGLAPYGDPERLRSAFDEICTLHSDGQFEIHDDKFPLLRCMWPARRRGEAFTQAHKDFAAALQEALERMVFHLLAHHREKTGLTQLCLAGGVSHNSSMVGKIVDSGMFDEVFVQPAAGDSGCALGAALYAYQELAPDSPVQPLRHVYWGTDIGGPNEVLSRLQRWQGLVEISRMKDPAREAARLLADGAVLGWVQGRSEFGPRALGNRSIIADPRPAENKERINALIKQREAYRPFAPSVLAEYAPRFFDVGKGGSYDYMTTVVSVRDSVRELLGAVTHVDGTARVQTVSRESNPRYWELLHAFNEITDVPILLNTSFNHSVEPIVDSVDDAVVCILTTGLTHLVVGDFLVVKREIPDAALLGLEVSLPEHVRVLCSRQTGADGKLHEVRRCESAFAPWPGRTLSASVYDVLSRADGHQRLDSLVRDRASLPALLKDLRELWSERLIVLLPPD